MSRANLVNAQVNAIPSTLHRLDDHYGAVSVSIGRVNEAVFESKRKKSGYRDWIILGLSPEILWTHDCLFCWANAASNEITKHRGRRDGPWAFERMFADDGRRRGLPPFCPTDPHAEVQVFETIAAHYILGVGVNRQELVIPVQDTLDQLTGEPRPVLFGEF
ncbi:hypothetical protein GCM10027343_42830 [Noviherbaspirillum agri]